MNIIWTVITAAALAALTAVDPQNVLSVCLNSCSQALTYALGLCAVYCLWLGVFNVAERCNLVQSLSRLLSRVNKLLYGNLQQTAADYVSLNMASNLLGVGNAATPSAIAAISQMERGDKLSRNGAMLFVINAAGVQLIPTTVIGLRAAAGSANPSDILLPNLIATAIGCAAGIALVFAAYGRAK